ncbi:hypothetical protein Tco_1443504 [Tanacetum coccineum]
MLYGYREEYDSVEYMDVERNEKGDSDQYQQNVDNNDQTVIQNEDPISNDVNVDVITKKQQQVYTKRTKLSLKKGREGMIEKQICPVATVIEPINAVPIRYAEPTKDGNDEQKEKHKGCVGIAAHIVHTVCMSK